MTTPAEANPRTTVHIPGLEISITGTAGDEVHQISNSAVVETFASLNHHGAFPSVHVIESSVEMFERLKSHESSLIVLSKAGPDTIYICTELVNAYKRGYGIVNFEEGFYFFMSAASAALVYHRRSQGKSACAPNHSIEVAKALTRRKFGIAPFLVR